MKLEIDGQTAPTEPIMRFRLEQNDDKVTVVAEIDGKTCYLYDFYVQGAFLVSHSGYFSDVAASGRNIRIARDGGIIDLRRGK